MGQVIKGWDQTVPGHNVGSRLVVSIPPEYGYGSRGIPQAGIGGRDFGVRHRHHFPTTDRGSAHDERRGHSRRFVINNGCFSIDNGSGGRYG